MEPEFKDFSLRLVQPSYDSALTDIVIELERLRSPRRLKSRVHPFIFAQLKGIFHTLESLGSVRIEGNNTELSEVVERTIDGTLKSSQEEKIKEFINNQDALGFIDSEIKEGYKIDRKLISELQKMTVAKLDPSQEGDLTPGQYRNVEVTINKSSHKPPLCVQVSGYMDEMIDFINAERTQKDKMLAIAIAHHRFTWVHPYRNGNGRTVRLLTYAMLMSNGFAVDHILNPTAVFCNDRDVYYKMLAEADTGTDTGLLVWSQYVLENLLSEIKKIDKLLDYDFLVPRILIPALDYSLERKTINEKEYKVLKLAVESEKMEVKAADINKILQKKHSPQVSEFIRKLKEGQMFMEIPNNKRHYTVYFANNYLLRGVINSLKQEGFLKALD
jgi:Fic family protein